MDSAHHLSHPACQADFTYEITVKTIKILDNGKGEKSVTKDLGAVLRKIEGWHQGSIAGFLISYRDTLEPCIRSLGMAIERPRKKFRQNLEDENLPWLSQAQALDRVPSRSAEPGRPLSALQNLLCQNSPSPLPQEPRTSPDPATRILRRAQGGDFGGAKGVLPRVLSTQQEEKARIRTPVSRG